MMITSSRIDHDRLPPAVFTNAGGDFLDRASAPLPGVLRIRFWPVYWPVLNLHR